MARLPFVIVKNTFEISAYIGKGFISTFGYLDLGGENNPDGTETDVDTDVDALDLDAYGCREVTSNIEEMVEATVLDCVPLENVYGSFTADIVRDTIKTATEESQCAALSVFGHIVPTDDRTLLETCTAVSYWCCCETIRKISPIIADATVTLLENY